MPLFGKTRRSGQQKETTPQPLFEEVTSQEYSLKLSYSAKSSEGVRLKAGPATVARLASMLDGYVQGVPELVEPLPVELGGGHSVHRPHARQRSVAPVPPQPIAGYAARPRRPGTGRRGRSRLRDAGRRPARRSRRHDWLPRLQRHRRRRGLALGRDHRRHDRPGRRGLGRKGRPRRHGSQRRASAGRPLQQRQCRRSHAIGTVVAERPVAAAGQGGSVCAHCGFASAHDRAFYCPKCGMRMPRG